jgi:hypothetical protein
MNITKSLEVLKQSLLVILYSSMAMLARADQLTSTIEGDLKVVTGLDYYGLRDAQFVWTLKTDTDNAPGIDAGAYHVSATFYWDESTMVITKTDGTVIVQDIPNPASSARNEYEGTNDLMYLPKVKLSEISPYLDMSYPKIYLPIDYWDVGEVPALPLEINPDSIAFGVFDAQPQRAVSYRPVNATIRDRGATATAARLLLGQSSASG